MIHKESNTVYSEVEALSVLKGYKTANAGCCKVGEEGCFASGYGNYMGVVPVPPISRRGTTLVTAWC